MAGMVCLRTRHGFDLLLLEKKILTISNVKSFQSLDYYPFGDSLLVFCCIQQHQAGFYCTAAGKSTPAGRVMLSLLQQRSAVCMPSPIHRETCTHVLFEDQTLASECSGCEPRLEERLTRHCLRERARSAQLGALHLQPAQARQARPELFAPLHHRIKVLPQHRRRRRRRRLHCCLRVGLLPAPPGGQARGRAKPRRWTRRRAPRHQDSRRLNTSSRTPSCRRAASRLARRSSAFAFRSFAFVRAFRSRCLGLSLPPEPPRMSFSFMPKLASISSSFSLASFLAFFFAKCFWT
mmetsp:Transcript_12348/g.19810  ORF Transcript_12348/g.19810 Transcript_12348/m.19810 type:complete len:293 (+) Transcript_12348:259-1137(+)